MEQNNEISASPLITIDLLHPFSTPFFTGNIMDKIKTHQGGIIISIYWYRWYCIPFTIYLPRVYIYTVYIIYRNIQGDANHIYVMSSYIPSIFTIYNHLYSLMWVKQSPKSL